MPICKQCKKTKLVNSFYSSNKSRCKECVCLNVRTHREGKAEHYNQYDRERSLLPHRVKAREDYAKTDAGIKAGEKAKARWIKRHPAERAAHIILGNAVRDGKIDKPNSCSLCDTGGRIHGHHDDYTKPLDVKWLCSKCHKKTHKDKDNEL